MTPWRSRFIHASAGALALLWSSLPTTAAPKGLKSTDLGPAPVTLTGFVAEKRFYGLPAYGAQPERDQKFNALLLLMREPIHGFLSNQIKEMKLTIGSNQVTLIGDTKTMNRIARYLGRKSRSPESSIPLSPILPRSPPTGRTRFWT